MTLREFLLARLEEEVALTGRKVREAAAHPEGWFLHPGADVEYRNAISDREVTHWLLKVRLRPYRTPRLARIQTMKALAYRWRHHPDYTPEWSPTA